MRSDGKPLGDPYPVGTTQITWTATNSAGNSTNSVQQVTVLNPKSISRNFNRHPIAKNDYLWFTAVVSPERTLTTNTSFTVNFIDASIRFRAGRSNYDLTVPNGSIIFSTNVTDNATTTFNGTQWVTAAPRHPRGNVLLTALAYRPTEDLPGDIENVTFSGTFLSTALGLELNWKWSASVYSTFTNESALLVKPTDRGTLQYANRDQAGTPEEFKRYLITGATEDSRDDYPGLPNPVLRVNPCPEVQSVAAGELRILSIQLHQNDAHITWIAPAGVTAILQEGSPVAGFVDIPGSLAVVPGGGITTNNYVIVGGATNMPVRFYRARLVP
jgi:hypothetical protein